MSPVRVAGLTVLTMVAFAGNSLLCRLALKHTAIDPASFTFIRLGSGALMLGLLACASRHRHGATGSWGAALALFVYAAGFSWAYVSLPAANGALLLFGAVQVTMVGYGLWHGERLARLQWAGLVLALAGVIVLLMPGLSAPPLAASLLMLGAGVAWGVYSLRGKGAANPVRVTAGNFVRAVPMALLCSLWMQDRAVVDGAGVIYALASGVLASGVGYAIWYSVLPSLDATKAAVVQLSVPAIAAAGGVVVLGEPLHWRLVLASTVILGGILLVIVKRKR
ncbi:DMT family transporter [Jeongeupia chitinilytica]|nr:DMT family transporter [Jeongeupia chitinilytica]